MIPIPPLLSPLLKRLEDEGIEPVLVGGYVRDSLLGKTTNDIDIELYHLSSLDTLERLLSEFGKPNLVGKSFGVLKLSLGNYTLDFSPPRSESKNGFGHKGFEIRSHTHMDYESASRRRDFTLNAIGYNPRTRTLLDPHHGCSDLESRILRHIDSKHFGDDPLRILRAVQFAARFDLTCDPELLTLCMAMIQHGALEELSVERIFEELKKLFLLSKKPSIGLKLLREMEGSALFGKIDEEGWQRALERCDNVTFVVDDPMQNILAKKFASILLESDQADDVIERLIFHTALARLVHSIIHHTRRYGMFEIPPPPLILGRDLIQIGLQPSNDFKTILDQFYTIQQCEKWGSRDEAIEWFKRHGKGFCAKFFQQ